MKLNVSARLFVSHRLLRLERGNKPIAQFDGAFRFGEAGNDLPPIILAGLIKGRMHFHGCDFYVTDYCADQGFITLLAYAPSTDLTETIAFVASLEKRFIGWTVDRQALESYRLDQSAPM